MSVQNNIGISKLIEQLCKGIAVRADTVKDFHLYDTLTEINKDLDMIIGEAERVRNLLVRLNAGRLEDVNKRLPEKP